MKNVLFTKRAGQKYKILNLNTCQKIQEIYEIFNILFKSVCRCEKYGKNHNIKKI